VCVLGDYSEKLPLQYGVPQGSVAGPPIFTAYAEPVAKIIKAFEVAYHIYADDTQLYVSFDPRSKEDTASAQLKLTNCIAEIRTWMLANKLKLNDSKTELFLLASPWYVNAVSHLDLKIGGSVISPSASIKNLGITFDHCLSMKQHVSNLCRNINFHLRNLYKIRRYIDRNTCAHAVRSLILSRLDYGNSLLAGMSNSDMQRLQRLQNRAARLIFQVGKRTSASPLLRELHWLPVQQRIDFKVLVHVYNSLNGSAPTYLKDLIQKHVIRRSGLRSSHDLSRLSPLPKEPMGTKLFQFLAQNYGIICPILCVRPQMCNHLKSCLKHIFSLSFSCQFVML
jgi:hypothetical protein